MRVLVCGGRDYDDYATLVWHLSELDPEVIIHGGAKGADSLAGRYAQENTIPVEVFEANWEEYGRAAGMLRNQRMIEKGKPDYVLAFKGGRGTLDLITRAYGKDIPFKYVTSSDWGVTTTSGVSKSIIKRLKCRIGFDAKS